MLDLSLAQRLATHLIYSRACKYSRAFQIDHSHSYLFPKKQDWAKCLDRNENDALKFCKVQDQTIQKEFLQSKQRRMTEKKIKAGRPSNIYIGKDLKMEYLKYMSNFMLTG